MPSVRNGRRGAILNLNFGSAFSILDIRLRRHKLWIHEKKKFHAGAGGVCGED
jgi:hypothetical protein